MNRKEMQKAKYRGILLHQKKKNIEEYFPTYFYKQLIIESV